MCCLACLPATIQSASQRSLNGILWRVSGARPVSPHCTHCLLTALRVAQAEDGTANKEARESVHGYVCLCVTGCVGRLKYPHLFGHFKPAGTSDCSCFVCVSCSKG